MENERTNWCSALRRGLIAGLALSGVSSRPPSPAELEIVNAMLNWRPSRHGGSCCVGVSAAPCCYVPHRPCCAVG